MSGFANSVLQIRLKAHLIKVRLARILPHPMTDEGWTEEDIQMVRDSLWFPSIHLKPPRHKPSLMTPPEPAPAGTGDRAWDQGVRMHAAFGTVDRALLKVDPYGWQETVDGFLSVSLEENKTLTVELRRADVLQMPPRGPKLLCLSNIDGDDKDKISHCHAVILADDSEETVQLSINAGTYDSLKVLSVFPYARFRVLESRWGDVPGNLALATMKRYLTQGLAVEPPTSATAEPVSAAPEGTPIPSTSVGDAPLLNMLSGGLWADGGLVQGMLGESAPAPTGDTPGTTTPPGTSPKGQQAAPPVAVPQEAASDITYGDDIKPDDVMDTDGRVGLTATTHRQLKVLGATKGIHNIAVAEDFMGHARFVIGAKALYKKVYSGLVFPPDADRGSSSFSGHVGQYYIYELKPKESDVSKTRWKILSAFSWVEGPTDSINTYDGDNRLSWGILNWISDMAENLPNLLAFLRHHCPSTFGTRFNWYGFSVWYARGGTGFGSENIAPFGKDVRILFPGCHGKTLKASLLNMKNGVWQDHHSIYGAWVFRMAGRDPAAQEAQLLWANRRLSAAIGQTKSLSEYQVAEAFEKNVNSKADHVQRMDQVKECAAKLETPLSTQPGSFEETVPVAQGASPPATTPPRVQELSRTSEWLTALPDPTAALRAAPPPDAVPLPPVVLSPGRPGSNTDLLHYPRPERPHLLDGPWQFDAPQLPDIPEEHEPIPPVGQTLHFPPLQAPPSFDFSLPGKSSDSGKKQKKKG